MLFVPWLESVIKGRGSRRGWILLGIALAWLKAIHVARRKHIRSSLGPPNAEPSGAQLRETEAPTFVSKQTLPFLLAFVAGWYDVICFKQYKCYANMMTGNTLNLCMRVGNRDPVDVSLIASAIANFSCGFTFFKYLDMKMKSRGSCTAVAPLILGLFTLTDVYRKKFPNARWHLLPLAVAGGIINSISAERAKIVTNMMTGHYQKLSSDLADYLSKGLSREQLSSASLSVRVVATFCSGVCAGMAAWNINHSFPSLAQRRFAIIGAIYAAILVLHELPRDFTFWRRKQVDSLAGHDH
jgi:uncharacterized membrane protein YoaK (UPF0700 family)